MPYQSSKNVSRFVSAVSTQKVFTVEMWYLLNGTATVDSTIFSFFSPGRRDPYFQVDCLLRPNTFERETGINDELEITQFMSNYFVDSIIFHIATSLFILISHFSSSSSSSSSSSFLVYIPSLSTNVLFFSNYTALPNCGSIISEWRENCKLKF